MSVIKSYSVGSGDMFSIQHNSDNFTIIDCHLNDDNYKIIIDDLKASIRPKDTTRFICTHPDEDHFVGIELLDYFIPISNFYAVRNQAVKDKDTLSFQKYCQLRDSDKAFHLYQGVRRRWLNASGDGRQGAGISVLWPELTN